MKRLIIFLTFLFFPCVVFGSISGLSVSVIAQHIGSHWDAGVTTSKDSIQVSWSGVGATSDSVVLVRNLWGYPVSRSMGHYWTTFASPSASETDTIAEHMPEPAYLYVVAYEYDSGAIQGADSTAFFMPNQHGGYPQLHAQFIGEWAGETDSIDLILPLDEIVGAMGNFHGPGSKAYMDSIYQIRGSSVVRALHDIAKAQDGGQLYNNKLVNMLIDTSRAVFEDGDNPWVIDGATTHDSTRINMSGGINSVQTIITVDDPQAFDWVPGSGYAKSYAIVGNPGGSTYEIWAVTGITSTTITVDRAICGSGPAKSWPNRTWIKVIAGRTDSQTDNDRSLMYYYGKDDRNQDLGGRGKGWGKIFVDIVYDWASSANLYSGNRLVEFWMNDTFMDHWSPYQEQSWYDSITGYWHDVDTAQTLGLLVNQNGMKGEFTSTRHMGGVNGANWDEASLTRPSKRFGEIAHPEYNNPYDLIALKVIELPRGHRELWFENHSGASFRIPYSSVYKDEYGRPNNQANGGTADNMRRYYRNTLALSSIMEGFFGRRMWTGNAKKSAKAYPIWLDEFSVNDTSFVAESRNDTTKDYRHWLGYPAGDITYILKGFTEPNKVINGEFENNAQYWTAGGTATRLRTTTYSHGGTSALKIIPGSGGNSYGDSYVQGNISSLSDSTVYTISFWAMSDSSRYFQWSIKDSSGTMKRWVEASGVVRGVWMRYVSEFTTGHSELDDYYIEIDVGDFKGQPGGNIYFDDVEICEGSCWAGLARRFDNGYVILNVDDDSSHYFTIPDSLRKVQAWEAVADTNVFWSDASWNDSTTVSDSVLLSAATSYLFVRDVPAVSDTFAPDNIDSIAASAIGTSSIDLFWVWPDSADVAGIEFRYQCCAVPLYPADHDSGSLFLNVTDKSVTRDTIGGLATGQTYYIRGFAYDEAFNYAVACTAAASGCLDSASVALSSNAVTVTVGERSTSDSSGYMWDTYIQCANPDKNYHDKTWWKSRLMSDSLYSRNPFLYADLSWLPDTNTVTIDYCSLSVFTQGDGQDTDTLFAYELADSMVDSLATWWSPLGDSSVVYWTSDDQQSGGIDYRGVDTSSVVMYDGVATPSTDATEMKFDLSTALTRARRDQIGAFPVGWIGVAFKDTMIGGTAKTYSSCEYAATSKRPELEIKYTIPSADTLAPANLDSFVATAVWSDTSGVADTIRIDMGMSDSNDADTIAVRYDTLGTYPTSPTDGTAMLDTAYEDGLDLRRPVNVGDSTIVYVVAFVGDTCTTVNWNTGAQDTAYVLMPDYGDTVAPDRLDSLVATMYVYDAGGNDSVHVRIGYTDSDDAESLLIEWSATAQPESIGDGTSLFRGLYYPGWQDTLPHAAGPESTIFYTAWVSDTVNGTPAPNWSEGTSDTAFFTASDDVKPAALNYFISIPVNTNPDSLLLRFGESTSNDADTLRVQAGVGAAPEARTDSTTVLAVAYAEYWDTTVAVTFADSNEIYLSAFVGDEVPNWSAAPYYWTGTLFPADTNTVLFFKFQKTFADLSSRAHTVSANNVSSPDDYTDDGVSESDTTVVNLEATASEWITIGDGDQTLLDMNTATGWSVEIIMKKTTFSDDGMIVWKGPFSGTGNKGWCVYAEYDTIRLSVGDGTSYNIWPAGASGFPDSTDWHYVVCTFDTVNAVGKVYIDGNQDGGDCDFSSVKWSNINSPDDFYVNQSGYLLDMAIDELRITREVLDSTTIANRWAGRVEGLIKGIHSIAVFMPGVTYPDSERAADPEFDSYKLKKHGGAGNR